MIAELTCKIHIKKIHDSDDIIGIKELIGEAVRTAVGEDCSFIEISDPYSEEMLSFSREIGGGRPLSCVINEMKGMGITQLRAITDAAVVLSKTAPEW